MQCTDHSDCASVRAPCMWCCRYFFFSVNIQSQSRDTVTTYHNYWPKQCSFLESNLIMLRTIKCLIWKWARENRQAEKQRAHRTNERTNRKKSTRTNNPFKWMPSRQYTALLALNSDLQSFWTLLNTENTSAHEYKCNNTCTHRRTTQTIYFIVADDVDFENCW